MLFMVSIVSILSLYNAHDMMICYAALFFMGAWDKPVKMLGSEAKQALPDCQAAKKPKPTLQGWFYLSLNLHSFLSLTEHRAA